jgi:Cu/Ag efflux pump CusA
MPAIVRLALRRPYTFVVMAILIAIFGTLAAIRTPVDIFPNIGIPVISNLELHRFASRRHVGPHRLFL